MYFHVWFVTKYRKATLEGEIERKAKDCFLEVARNKNYSILEMETNKDHVHMLLEAADKEELSAMVRTLKAVSAREILRTPHFRVRNGYYRRKPVEPKQHFWARRYGYKEVDISKVEGIRDYIRNQKKIAHA